MKNSALSFVLQLIHFFSLISRCYDGSMTTIEGYNDEENLWEVVPNLKSGATMQLLSYEEIRYMLLSFRKLETAIFLTVNQRNAFAE